MAEPDRIADRGDRAPRVVRITRLVSRPGMGAELAHRCRHIAQRERDKYPGAYVVTQARQPLEDDRIEVISITQWIDLALMARLMPAGRHELPAFHDEYADCLESWRVEVFEVTWPLESDLD
ncbi:MAG TPA: hypothetical protein VFK54_04705 [Candidatus Limnocylindrales bacterium]|nr:hypothetical protein [Candidatus Limnocylindrales bacterium]